MHVTSHGLPFSFLSYSADGQLLMRITELLREIDHMYDPCLLSFYTMELLHDH